MPKPQKNNTLLYKGVLAKEIYSLFNLFSNNKDHTSHTQKIIFDQLSIIQTWNATGSRVYTEI